MPSEQLQQSGVPTHILSQTSISRNFDTFIWWKSSSPVSPSRLVVGLNNKRTPVTRAILYRWLHFLDPGYMSELEIRPCTVVPYGILSYSIIPDKYSPVISSSDSSPLPPGDYGLFPGPSGNIGVPFQHPPHPCSFAGLRSLAERHPGRINSPGLRMSDPFKLNAFPPNFEETVQSRDKKCIITGAEVDLDVCWIFPPAWSFLLDLRSNPRTFDYAPFTTVSNAGLMRKDLIPLFLDNAFGVDVDDNHRIIVFRDLGSVTLPSHLPKTPLETHGDPVIDDKYLREHFRWCLFMNLPGGDISEDYTFHDILSYMDNLGLLERGQIMVPMDDERWNTVLGKAIWENILMTKVARSRYENEPVSDPEDEGEAETNSADEIQQTP